MIAFSKLAILSEQHVLLPGASDAALDVLQATADMLQDAAVPGLSCSIESVAAGGLRSLFGTRHDYLVVIFGRAFPEHVVLIGCTPLGSALEVTVFVAGAERPGRRLRRLLLFRDPLRRDEIGAELGPREAAALAARIEVVRGCLDRALADIAAPDADRRFAESLEPDRLDTESED